MIKHLYCDLIWMKNNNKFFDNYYLIIDFRFGNWINKLIKINCKNCMK